MAGRPTTLFLDGKPMKVADVRKLVLDKERETKKKKRYRKVKSRPLRRSYMQILEFAACMRPLLQAAAFLQGLIDAPRQAGHAGRPCEYKVIDAILFELGAWLFRSYTTTMENLYDDPWNWNRVRTACINAWPDNSEWWPSETPISRSGHYRFRNTYLGDKFLDEQARRFREIAVEAGVDTEILVTTGKKQVTKPSNILAADGSFTPAFTGTPQEKAVDPEDGTIKRYDPDAVQYKGKDENWIGSPGYVVVFIGGRSDYSNHRIVFDADSTAKNSERDETGYNPAIEANAACRMFLDLIRDFPHQLAKVTAFAYDMAMRSVDIDRLLDAGIIPLVKTPYVTRGKSKKGRPAEANIGPHTFTKKDNTAFFETVYGVNGTPCIIIEDHKGVLWFVPLERIQTKVNAPTDPATGKHRIYGKFKIPECAQTAGTGKAHATVWIIHNSSADERKAGPNSRHHRRTRALSAIPESDPWFQLVYGRREDIESINSDFKARLRYGRCRCKGKHSVRFMLLAFQLKTIVYALIAYQQRTGADISKWVGNYKPPVRGKPLPLPLAA